MFSVFSSVQCVRFSADSKYLATGCKEIAQIYDIKTGVKIWFGPFLVDGAPGSNIIVVAQCPGP